MISTLLCRATPAQDNQTKKPGTPAPQETREQDGAPVIGQARWAWSLSDKDSPQNRALT
jgi:hypothetical protein